MFQNENLRIRFQEYASELGFLFARHQKYFEGTIDLENFRVDRARALQALYLAYDDPTNKLANPDLVKSIAEDRVKALFILEDMIRRQTDAELDLRREQGGIIIDAIERQRRDVLQAQRNALEAERQAAVRAVGARFDFQEAALRAKYLPQFRHTQSEAGRSVLLGQVGREIEVLRRSESQALEAALNAMDQQYNQRMDTTNAYYDGTRAGRQRRHS